MNNRVQVIVEGDLGPGQHDQVWSNALRKTLSDVLQTDRGNNGKTMHFPLMDVARAI